MELDNFKNSWEQYDKKLSDNLRLNEALLRKISLKSSKQEMKKLLIFELFNIVFAVILILFVFSNSIYYIHQIRFSIPGFICIASAIIYLIFSIVRLRAFLKMDYYGSPVVKVQNDLLSLKSQNLRFRKYELILLPVLILPSLPLLFKVVHNIDIYQHLYTLWIEMIIILGLAYPLVFLSYKYFYDKKFKNAEQHLSDLKNFEQEDEIS